MQWKSCHNETSTYGIVILDASHWESEGLRAGTWLCIPTGGGGSLTSQHDCLNMAAISRPTLLRCLSLTRDSSFVNTWAYRLTCCFRVVRVYPSFVSSDTAKDVTKRFSDERYVNFIGSFSPERPFWGSERLFDTVHRQSLLNVSGFCGKCLQPTAYEFPRWSLHLWK